jgi:hypothetical protein
MKVFLKAIKMTSEGGNRASEEVENCQHNMEKTFRNFHVVILAVLAISLLALKLKG